jgi:hypothetical protein
VAGGIFDSSDNLISCRINRINQNQVLVLDEADLLLSYGYEDDLRLLAPHVSE